MSDPIPSPPIDLRGASHDALLAFVFDHPPAASPAGAWYWSDELDWFAVRMEPRQAVEFLTRLFRDPTPVLERYTPAQIEEGFWMMFSAAAEHLFRDALWDPRVPWPRRQACIQEIPTLFERLFRQVGHRMEHDTPFMLPDFLAYGYDSGTRSRENAEDARVQDALFDAFRRMLASGHDGVRWSALHGLFHLSHPETPDTVHAFLAAHPDLDPELRTYAEKGLEGHVL